MDIKDLTEIIAKQRIEISSLENQTETTARLGSANAEAIISKITAVMLKALDDGDEVRWRRIGTFSRGETENVKMPIEENRTEKLKKWA